MYLSERNIFAKIVYTTHSMKQYETFIFDEFHFDPEKGRIELKYSLDDEVTFTEVITLPKGALPKVDEEVLNRALFGLHLIGGISYTHTSLPKKIEIRSGKLSHEQADYWNEVYTKGLGEFFYKNKIDFRGLIKFPSVVLPAINPIEIESTGMSLVPIGGGKDSLVTVELLKKELVNVTLFRLTDHPLIQKMSEIADVSYVAVERELSPLLFALNKDGALNGHVPISAYISWLTLVTAILYGFDAIIMSNEKSADEGNVEYLGMQVNHQWSKSREYEELFQKYVYEFITPSVTYFSLLRSLNELQIAKLVAGFPEYFPVMTSCNTNWKILEEKSDAPKWCGVCPKCAFAFAVLAAFIPKDEMLEMFKKNLFDEDAVQIYYKELLGLENFKPFECVGTPSETKAAFALIQKRGDYAGTKAMNMFEKDVLPTL